MVVVWDVQLAVAVGVSVMVGFFVVIQMMWFSVVHLWVVGVSDLLDDGLESVVVVGGV